MAILSAFGWNAQRKDIQNRNIYDELALSRKIAAAACGERKEDFSLYISQTGHNAESKARLEALNKRIEVCSESWFYRPLMYLERMKFFAMGHDVVMKDEHLAMGGLSVTVRDADSANLEGFARAWARFNYGKSIVTKGFVAALLFIPEILCVGLAKLGDQLSDTTIKKINIVTRIFDPFIWVAQKALGVVGTLAQAVISPFVSRDLHFYRRKFSEIENFSIKKFGSDLIGGIKKFGADIMQWGSDIKKWASGTLGKEKQTKGIELGSVYKVPPKKEEKAKLAVSTSSASHTSTLTVAARMANSSGASKEQPAQHAKVVTELKAMMDHEGVSPEPTKKRDAPTIALANVMVRLERLDPRGRSTNPIAVIAGLKQECDLITNLRKVSISPEFQSQADKTIANIRSKIELIAKVNNIDLEAGKKHLDEDKKPEESASFPKRMR